MRGLIVDDSRTFRLIVAQILDTLGIESVQAANGREGLQQLARCADVEIVFVDWNMPVMNGIDFIQAVRQRCEFNSVRLMMVTTESQQEYISRALNAGADDYLVKPFTKETFVAKLSLLDIYKG